MTSWIRRRFDSAESDDIPESPEESDSHPENLPVMQSKCHYESEISKSKVTKVKTQWQKAVRKLSLNSSGYGSASGDASPAISGSGSRVSMEKPAWILRQQLNCQPRSRHMSINGDAHPVSGFVPIPEGRPVNPEARNCPSNSLPPYMASDFCKSRTPSGSSEHDNSSGLIPDSPEPVPDSSHSDSEGESLTNEFPYGPAFQAAMGRITTFPDGTEAVMIDSALALQAFKTDQMVK